MIQGYENKDAGFLSSIRKTSDMPHQVLEVLEAFGPELKKYDYANNFSMEIRVKGEDSYFIDPCCRFPMPPTASKTEIWANIAEVIAAGAEGEMVEPIASCNFAAECAIQASGDKKEWRCTEVPKELEQWMKFSNCCKVNDLIAFPPLEFSGDTVGWLVATADNLDDLITTMTERVALLPNGLKADTMPIIELLKEVHEAENQGIEFTPQEVPEPASVIES